MLPSLMQPSQRVSFSLFAPLKIAFVVVRVRPRLEGGMRVRVPRAAVRLQPHNFTTPLKSPVCARGTFSSNVPSMKASCDDQRFTRNPGGVWRGEEDSSRGNVFGLTDAPQ